MVEKTNTNTSTPGAIKSSNKKLDDGTWPQRRPRHRKGNKKSTNQLSVYIGGTEELETGIFAYGATMRKD